MTPPLLDLLAEGRVPLVVGDCLDVAAALPEGCVDLVYADPPFFSGRIYVIPGTGKEGKEGGTRGRRAFSDIWARGLSGYVEWLGVRLEAMRRLLRPTGSIYVHLDWHACHYVKVAMDRIFGHDAFLNHVVWLYGLGGSSSRYWPRKHDDLLWYAREPGRHYFEASRVPARSRRMAGQSKKAPDWWDIPSLNNLSRERLGYPTQKPEALLTRIVESSCPPDGVVTDLFCGSGTTGAAALRLGRRFLGGDISPGAVALTARRLEAIRPGSVVVVDVEEGFQIAPARGPSSSPGTPAGKEKAGEGTGCRGRRGGT